MEPEYTIYQHPIDKPIQEYVDNVIIPTIKAEIPYNTLDDMKKLAEEHGIENAAIRMHMGLGMWIRNTFKLWHLQPSETIMFDKQLGGPGDGHTDSLSDSIIKYILNKVMTNG